MGILSVLGIVAFILVIVCVGIAYSNQKNEQNAKQENTEVQTEVIKSQSSQKVCKCPNCGNELSPNEIKCRVCFSCDKLFHDEDLLKQGVTIQEIGEISSSVKPNSNTVVQNIFSYILKGVGILLIIIGVLSCVSLISDGGNFALSVLCLISVCAFGFFLMGIGEIIQILDDIRSKN